jgi:DNA segregation ATPase FtsK/SpoIIIE, S-DNA-T family
LASPSRKSKRKQTAVRRLPAISPVARRRIGGAALLLLGAGTGLSLMFPLGPVTWTVSAGMMMLAGWGAMVIPVSLLWGGAAVLRLGPNGGFQIQRRQAAGAALLVLAFLGLLHLIPSGSLGPLERASSGHGGGYIGFALTWLLEPNLGSWGTVLVLVASMLTGILVLGWLRADDVLKLARTGWTAFRTWREERKREVRINAARELAVPTPRTNGRKPNPPAKPSPPGEAPSQVEEEAPPRPVVRSHREWALPPIDIFEHVPVAELSQVDIKQRIKTIEETLKSFGVEARVVEVNQGPAVTQFGVEPGIGVKVARIMALGNDLALRLAAAPLRLEAPVPGKQVVGIEVPNGVVSIVSIRDLLESAAFNKHRGRLRLALGRDVSGATVVGDLSKMPHLLIAGSTGSGKSVCLNSFIAALLFQCTPDELRMLMIDPKMVEMAPFNGIPHLLTPVVCEMDKVVPALKWVTKEMERRYRLFAARGARNIEGYNRATTGNGSDLPLPYIVVIIDELADLMMTAPDEVEKILCRLAQLARATGIHLVVATQRPSVDVVTGLIKANFPTRIAFAVTSQIDSRVILDQSGAERLLGRGDMLYMPTDAAKPIRVQGTYVSDGEILDMVDYWKKATPAGYSGETADHVAFEPVEEEESDDLYEQAVELVSQHTRVSTSLLQRRLKIGYNRAARLMELLEENSVVASSDGGKAREVLIRSEESGEDDGPGEM